MNGVIKTELLMENDWVQSFLAALSQRNLVYNYDFRYFSNADYSTETVTYGNPDGWFYSDPGVLGSLSLNDKGALLIRKSNDKSLMTLKQAIHEFPKWQSVLAGKTVTAKVHCNISSGCGISVKLTDGVKTKIEELSNHNESCDLVLSISLMVSDLPSQLTLSIESSSNSAQIIISRIYANIGYIAIEGLPCLVEGIIGERKQYISTENAPVEELSLCCLSKELTENQTRLDSVLNGRFGRGSNGRSKLPDMRGYFSRSWNNDSQTDPDAKDREALGTNPEIRGDKVGTKQEDEFNEHQHTIPITPVTIGNLTANQISEVPSANTIDTGKTGGKETRPKNVYELYTIKWA